jgi:hypothetical protein
VADSAFTAQEINDLTQSLTDSQQNLTPQERQLLLAIFAAAGDNVQVVEGPAALAPLDAEELTADELKEQLLGSFAPGVLFAAAEAHSHGAHPLKIVGK